MFCKYCGKQIEDNAKFCCYCGHSLVEEEKKSETEEVKSAVVNNDNPVVVNKDSYEYDYYKKPKTQLTNKQKIFIGGGALALVAIIVLVCIFVFGPKRINIFDGSQMVSYGYDGFGYINMEAVEGAESPLKKLEYEYEKMIEEGEEACALDYSSSKCKSIIEKAYYYENFFSNFGYHIEYDNPEQDGYHLNNGDKVTIVMDYDPESLSKLGYKFSPSQKTFTVSGLEELNTVDLFSDVKMKWISSNWYGFGLEIENIDDKDYYCLYEFDEEPDSSGNITLRVDADRLAQNYGLKSSDGKYEYVIHVGSKPQLIEEITDENRASIEAMAYSIINDIYCNKCGWSLYVGNNIITIVETSLQGLFDYSGNCYATFIVKLSDGKSYYKEISFKPYIDSDGSLKNATEYDTDNISCAVSYSWWD